MNKIIEVLGPVRDVLNAKLFAVSGTPVTLSSLITAFFMMALGFWIASLADRGIERTLQTKLLSTEGNFSASRRLFRYLILLIFFGISMNTIGIDVSALFTAGAIFAVGIGFAMQNIAQNFVSGVILLVERSIKPGDVIRIDGTMVKVEQMGIRATTARTREEEELIIPNASLAQSTVINYSLHDRLLRLRSKVGVSYSSDMKEVRRVLEEVGQELSDSKLRRPSTVILLEFGDSSVIWELSTWINIPWNETVARGKVLETLWFALKEAGIEIAFPQMDVHFDVK